MKKQNFVYGAVILTLAALSTKILGFINNIVMARLLGPEGIGLLMMATPLIPLIIVLTSLGLPVAISKMVAEAEIKKEEEKIKKIFLISLIITLSLSIILTSIVLIFSNMISHIFLPDQRAYYAMLVTTPIIPIVAISSVIKGYFRGKQNMNPLALSQIIEQVIRILFIIILTNYFLPYGIEYAVAGAMLSSVIGEGASLIYLLVAFKKNKKIRLKRNISASLKDEKKIFSELLNIGIPTTGSGIIGSIYGAFQPMLITKSLILSGISTILATKQFGLLVGYALPLVLIPTFITNAFSITLVPAISEAKVTGNDILIHKRINQAFKIALLVGAPSTLILYLWSTPISIIFYQTSEASYLIKNLAPFFFLHYFHSSLTAILSGLGKANVAMWNYLIGIFIRVVSIFLLGSNPELGINGIVIAFNLSVCLITLLNFFSISKIIGFYLHFKGLFKVTVALTLMALIGERIFLLTTDLNNVFNLVLSISVSLIIYFLILTYTGLIKYSSIKRFKL